jgi:type I restriction enzyme S subunit
MPDTPNHLPPGWRVVRFDQMAENIVERVDKPSEAGVQYYVGLEHLDPESLKLRRWGTPDDVSATKLKFQPGDIIFGRRRAYQRKLAVAEFEGICSAHALVLRAREETVLPGFLPFFMQSDVFFERAMAISVGSLSPTINWKALARQEFAIPPRAEQQRIAELLWAADAAVEGYRLVIEELQSLRRALWLDFANKNITTVPMGNVAKISNGSTPSRRKTEYWEGGTVPWLPTQKVHDRLIQGADEFITQLAVEEWPMRVFPANSVLVAMIGEGKTRGMAAYLGIDACINQNFACVTPTKDIDSWYLFACLDNSYSQLRNFSQGSSQGALNCRVLQKFPIPLPSRTQQLHIGGTFHAIDERINMVNSHISRVAFTKQLLQERLLAPDHQAEQEVQPFSV